MQTNLSHEPVLLPHHVEPARLELVDHGVQSVGVLLDVLLHQEDGKVLVLPVLVGGGVDELYVLEALVEVLVGLGPVNLFNVVIIDDPSGRREGLFWWMVGRK